MPILFKDYCVCEKCKKEFEWVRFEFDRQNGSAPAYFVEKVPNEPKAHILSRNGNSYELSVICPFCDYDNIFTYEDNQ